MQPWEHALARDLERIKYGLAFALFNGGNLPPGFLDRKMDYRKEGKMARATCSPCGRDFAGITAFDMHQDVDYERTPAVICMDPETVGLVRRPDGVWSTSEASPLRGAAKAAAGAQSAPQGPPEGNSGGVVR